MDLLIQDATKFAERQIEKGMVAAQEKIDETTAAEQKEAEAAMPSFYFGLELSSRGRLVDGIDLREAPRRRPVAGRTDRRAHARRRGPDRSLHPPRDPGFRQAAVDDGASERPRGDRGTALVFKRLTELTPEVGSVLAWHPGKLDFIGCEDISDDALSELEVYKGVLILVA